MQPSHVVRRTRAVARRLAHAGEKILRRAKRRPARPDPVLTCQYEGHEFHYPANSLLGQYMTAGGWDTALRPILEALVAEDAVIAEVGSNIGASLLQMKLARPTARFVCFEPSARFLPILRRNIEANGWSDVTVEETVLASAVETRRLFTNASTASVVAADYDGHDFLFSSSFRTTTLDVYFVRAERLDFLKVDTDGFDYDVLLGGRATLGRLRPILYFEFDRKLIARTGRSAESLLLYLTELGYSQFLVLSNDGEALGVGDTKDVLRFANREFYVDLLALPRERADAHEALLELSRRIGTNYRLESPSAYRGAAH